MELNKQGFVEVAITKEMLAEARKRDKAFKEKYGNSGTFRTDKKDQRMTGYVAEIAIKSVYPELEFSPDDHIDFTYKNMTFDSKAQGCKTPPLKNYSATLYENQKGRKVDFYIFNRVREDMKMVWIGGIIAKEAYLKAAILRPKGYKCNNFTYDQARYEMPYSDLGTPSDILLFSENNMGVTL